MKRVMKELIKECHPLMIWMFALAIVGCEFYNLIYIQYISNLKIPTYIPKDFGMLFGILFSYACYNGFLKCYEKMEP